MILKAQGIVLNSYDLRETSRIAVFFTREYGKVSGVLKGIRKTPRKFSSSVERFSVNDIVYYQYRNTDLHLISQCDLREYFYPIRQDLKKAMAASYITELVQRMMPVEEKNEAIYRLIIDFLGSLQGVHEAGMLVHFFQIKALSYSGFKPHLDTCVRCHQAVQGPASFSIKEGGLVCDLCSQSYANLESISQAAVSTLAFVEREDWQTCQRLSMIDSVKKELKFVLNHFLVYHLGRKIKSAQYIS